MQKLPSRIGERRVSAAPCCTSSGSKRHSYVLVNKRRGTIIHNSVNIKTLLIQIVEHNSTVCAQNVIVLGAAKSFSGSIDECTSPGFYYCSPSGNLPDLGGKTSAWYYIIVIGRSDVCQYVFKNQGEKLAIRTKTTGQSWSAWKVFSPS